MSLGEVEALPGSAAMASAVVEDQPKAAGGAGAAAAAGKTGAAAAAGVEDLSDDMELLGKTDKIVVEQRAKFSEACCGYEGKILFEIFFF